MNEVESNIQLELFKIDGDIKATIINGGEVVISTTSQFQNVVFEQHISTNAVKIGSQFDPYGREIECHIVHMTEYEFDCINDPINNLSGLVGIKDGSIKSCLLSGMFKSGSLPGLLFFFYGDV